MSIAVAAIEGDLMATLADDNALKKCAAVVFAPDASGSAMLVGLATSLGFGYAADYTDVANIPQAALPFFIVHGDLPEPTRIRLLASIRASRQITRKYAPVICVQPSGPRHLIVRLVELGYDEVLFLSDPVDALARKLAEQLRRDVIFVETANYLGPDRRRLEIVDRGDTRRKPGGRGGFRRLNVLRNPDQGISVHYIS